MLTQNDIHDFLKNAGITHKDTVLIHTSMHALGEVEGGCDGLIDGFISYLTDGLLVIPTHTWDNVSADQPVFDVRSTVPCIGALPTVAAFRKDGFRSLHPTHSVAAFGKRAKDFVSGEEKATTPCPAGGVWNRLYDENATILLLGVELNRNTYIHAVDEMLDLPGRIVPAIPLTIIDHDGVSKQIQFQKHSKYTGSGNYTNFRKPFEYLGALTYGQLGNAKVGIFNAKKGTEILKNLWAKADYNLVEKAEDVPEEYYI